MAAKPSKNAASSSYLSPRDQVVSGARRLFFSSGFRGVTMDDLAAELGMSKKTLYQQFRSKDELLMAVIDAKFSQADAELAAVMQQPDRPMPERLKGLLTTLQRHIHEISPAFIRDVQRSDPSLFQTIDERRQALIRRHFGALLEQGRREGAVRRDVPTDFMVDMLLAAARTLVTPDRLVRLNLNPQKVFQQMIEIFLNGILPRDGGKR